MNRINPWRRQFKRRTCAALFAVFVFQATAADAPFRTGDLTRFLADSVPFLEWIQSTKQERMIERLAENPNSVAEFPEAKRFLRDRGWEPERFAYVLNHVLVAYKMLGMGGKSSRLLAKLAEAKAAVQGDATQSDSEKARVLATIAQCQLEARKTEKAFAELPAEEVRLMWLRHAELHKVLDGRLPLKPCVLPNPARKP